MTLLFSSTSYNAPVCRLKPLTWRLKTIPFPNIQLVVERISSTPLSFLPLLALHLLAVTLFTP